MEKIREQIKTGNFDHVYLLYGDEQQVVKIYRNKLLEAWFGTDKLETLKQDMNFSLFIGAPLDVASVVDIASSVPFLAERRVVLIENAKAFSKEDSALIQCVKNLPDSTYMIFTEATKPEKKGLYNAIKETGHIAEINEQPQGFVENWVVRQISESGKRISKAALETLIMRTGLDRMRLSNEIEKIIAYKGDEQDIKVEDITALVSQDPKDQVFKMIDAIADKKCELAMRYYTDLLELKVSPQKILSLMERHIRILYQVKDLRSKGFASNAIVESVKDVKKFAVNKYISQAQKFSMKDITNCLTDCVDMNLESRTGAISDRLAVEMIIVKYSEKNAG